MCDELLSQAWQTAYAAQSEADQGESEFVKQKECVAARILAFAQVMIYSRDKDHCQVDYLITTFRHQDCQIWIGI